MFRHDYLGLLPARRRLDSGLVEVAATAPCVTLVDNGQETIRMLCSIDFGVRTKFGIPNIDGGA